MGHKSECCCLMNCDGERSMSLYFVVFVFKIFKYFQLKYSCSSIYGHFPVSVLCSVHSLVMVLHYNLRH